MQAYHFECDTVCGFMIQGYNKEEIGKIAMAHVKASHSQLAITDEMIQGMITTVDTNTEKK